MSSPLMSVDWETESAVMTITNHADQSRQINGTDIR